MYLTSSKRILQLALMIIITGKAFAVPAQSGLQTLIPSPPQVSSKAYILVEANSNQVLAEKDSEKSMPPASLTKVMTMYVASEALKNGQIALTDKVHISKKAWQAEGARMFLNEGSNVELEKIINGVVIASGNDATIALAEHVAGSEESFAEMMNITAKRLGMNHSHFVNASGLPNKEHYTTAKDLSILARAVIKDFPEEYHIYKQKWIEYNHIKQPNRNRLLWRNNKVDGIKTGHTDEAGFCLIASAADDQMRLINVQLGSPSDSARTNSTQAMLTWGMRFYETRLMEESNHEVAKIRTYGGQETFTPLGIKENLYVTLPKGIAARAKVVNHIEKYTNAPLSNDQEIGDISVIVDDQIVSSTPLYTLAANNNGSLWQRSTDYISWMWNKVAG
jgi:D-alanyl-D-alanine carboxypeptidase (penicillin-binding protein 5/6)